MRQKILNQRSLKLLVLSSAIGGGLLHLPQPVLAEPAMLINQATNKSTKDQTPAPPSLFNPIIQSIQEQVLYSLQTRLSTYMPVPVGLHSYYPSVIASTPVQQNACDWRTRIAPSQQLKTIHNSTYGFSFEIPSNYSAVSMTAYGEVEDRISIRNPSEVEFLQCAQRHQMRGAGHYLPVMWIDVLPMADELMPELIGNEILREEIDVAGTTGILTRTVIPEGYPDQGAIHVTIAVFNGERNRILIRYVDQEYSVHFATNMKLMKQISDSLVLDTDASSLESLSGTWEGSYICSQGTTNLRLVIDAENSSNVLAAFIFSPSYNNPHVPSGSFRMNGTYANFRSTDTSNRLELYATEWINRPEGYSTVDLAGNVFPSEGRITGRITTTGCSTFEVFKR